MGEPRSTGNAHRVLERELNSIAYVRRQTQRLTASQYQMTPSRIVIPCGSGSSALSWILASNSPL